MAAAKESIHISNNSKQIRSSGADCRGKFARIEAPKPYAAAVLLCIVLGFCGCHRHFSITAPAPPAINPGQYSIADYNDDVQHYKDATTPGPNLNPDWAKQSRNNIAYGLMTLIDVVYGNYYNKLFSSKNAIAVGGDAITLGLSAAASIATNTATKTILSALGTGFAGLSLSVDKNYFAQQAFPVIGIAMQTRRDKIRATIVANLTQDTTTYPLLAAKRDLVAYLNAGTLAAGLQELQEEAGVATASGTAPSQPSVTPSTLAGAAATVPPVPGRLTAVDGPGQVSLVWPLSSGATFYNLYYSTSDGVTPSNGTKIGNITTNAYTHSGLKNGTYYYVVTASNAKGESGPSPQASATVHSLGLVEPAIRMTPH
jgi:hypothetical protein